MKVRRSKFFLKYTEVLDLLCDWYIQILHIPKLRQFIVSINWYWTVKVKFYLYKCVRLREYWPFVDQEDTVLSGVTLNFVDWASVFVSSVKSLSNGQFMIQGHSQMHFHPLAVQKFWENEKSTISSGKNAFILYGRTCTTIFSLSVWQFRQSICINWRFSS